LPSCDRVHAEYDRHANGLMQVGSLPPWTHFSGKVAWYVFQGPYSKLSEGWTRFMEKAHSAPTVRAGPPGDIYVCDPAEHKGKEESIITIFWAPVK
jgi:effector-binding domain-containing protein